MTARAVLPRITPDDLLAMPDGDAYELIDGRLREKHMSYKSSSLAARILVLWGIYLETRDIGTLSGEGGGFRCFPDDPEKVRRPDAAFISYTRLPAELYEAPGHTPACPELIVEVISPNDTVDETDLKIQDWLAAGAVAVWSVHPAIRHVHVHRADGTSDMYGQADAITAEDVLPGFRMPVASLFQRR